jgi:TonB-dependent SusC/RagA subfamily outer membrane receptor
LQGKVAGVNITATNGLSGSGTNIIIRGYSSATGSNQPLFVVDGVPFNTNTNATNGFTTGGATTSSRFLDIDPNNIENVSVLKGLSATVLYGDQGRNGVILITTKSGASKRRAAEVTVNQSLFSNSAASLPSFGQIYGNGFQQQPGCSSLTLVQDWTLVCRQRIQLPLPVWLTSEMLSLSFSYQMRMEHHPLHLSGTIIRLMKTFPHSSSKQVWSPILQYSYPVPMIKPAILLHLVIPMMKASFRATIWRNSTSAWV